MGVRSVGVWYCRCVTFSMSDMSDDRHGSTYVGELSDHPDAAAELFAILSDHDNAVRLVTASELGLSALSGIASRLEAAPAVARVLSGSPASPRFRQAVGVAVRIRMQALGWAPTGIKGVVVNARYFGKAERFTPAV